jgi:hypothetical protein
MQQSRTEGKLPRVTLRILQHGTPGDSAGRSVMNPSVASSRLAREGIGLAWNRGRCSQYKTGA